MTLQYCRDGAAADWLGRAEVPWDQLVGFGPAGFPAYGRLRFIPDPTRPGQVESEVDLVPEHPSDLEQTQRALDILRRFTSTPEHCYFCVWEGYGNPPRSLLLPAPTVAVPHRRYFLLQSGLSDLACWAEVLGELAFPPAFAWPVDHRWCFACDVDPHWAGIGAERAAVDALLDAPHLDVVPARPAEPQPTYY